MTFPAQFMNLFFRLVGKLAGGYQEVAEKLLRFCSGGGRDLAHNTLARRLLSGRNTLLRLQVKMEMAEVKWFALRFIDLLESEAASLAPTIREPKIVDVYVLDNMLVNSCERQRLRGS